VLPHQQIELKLQAAVLAVLPDADVSAVLVRPCDPKFGDYQSNALMSLAKARKLNPRQLATDVVAKLDLSEICEQTEIAGAGFLNFRLKNSVLAQTLDAAARGEHLFFAKAARPKTVVIDFSSPNVAKPMHVGHIRSTGIGDALQRTLRLLGHRVISDNHIGDWGTQFGKLLLGWKQILNRDTLGRDPIAEMERLYKVINAEFRGTYFEEILTGLPFPFGRTRILRVPPQKCYPVHTDHSIRYHLALDTHVGAFIVYPEVGKVYHIPADGYLYRMDARVPHTAVNCGPLTRAHMVIITDQQ